jgi:1-deoxy-D-xylulose-5-phosphate reductoisomerase
MKAVTILGATGSIGTSALDVIARHPERYRVHALTAQSNVTALADLALHFDPEVVVIGDASLEGSLREALRERGARARVAGGRDALVDVARAPEVDAVLAAIVGAAGLVPTLAAAEAGKRLMLANKEAIVSAGALLMGAVRRGGA